MLSNKVKVGVDLKKQESELAIWEEKTKQKNEAFDLVNLEYERKVKEILHKEKDFEKNREKFEHEKAEFLEKKNTFELEIPKKSQIRDELRDVRKRSSDLDKREQETRVREEKIKYAQELKEDVKKLKQQRVLLESVVGQTDKDVKRLRRSKDKLSSEVRKKELRNSILSKAKDMYKEIEINVTQPEPEKQPDTITTLIAHIENNLSIGNLSDIENAYEKIKDYYNKLNDPEKEKIYPQIINLHNKIQQTIGSNRTINQVRKETIK